MLQCAVLKLVRVCGLLCPWVLWVHCFHRTRHPSLVPVPGEVYFEVLYTRLIVSTGTGHQYTSAEFAVPALPVLLNVAALCTCYSCTEVVSTLIAAAVSAWVLLPDASRHRKSLATTATINTTYCSCPTRAATAYLVC